MRFENEFSVEAPPDEVFQTLMDLEKVAPAMPGAQVTDKVSDDQYKVAIKVKLGPMTMNYRGDVEIREKDPEKHRATMHVKAREARGQGTATADVTMSIDQESSGSHAKLVAEVQLAGKAAAMGRGLIEDVSKKLVDQFASNLSEMLSGNGAAAAEQPEPVASPGQEQPAVGAATAAAQAPPKPSATTPPPRPPASDDDAIDAGGLATAVVKDKLGNPRTVGIALGLGLLIAYLVRRRSG